MNAMQLGEDLGIEASADLKQRLADGLEQRGVLRLDGSQVRRVHTAGMQVLCALFRSRRAAGLDTELQGASEALRDAARLLGLSAQLGLDANQKDTMNPVENAA